jgi:integrase
MGRHLKGTVQRTESGSWRASVPAAHGSKARTTRTFRSKGEASAWRKSAIGALSGRPVTAPVPISAEPGRLSVLEIPTPTAIQPAQGESDQQGSDFADSIGLSSLEQVSAKWLDLHFRRHNKGGISREEAARDNLKQFLSYARSLGWTSGLDVTYDEFTAFFEFLVDMREAPESMRIFTDRGPRFKNGRGYAAMTVRNKKQDIVRALKHGRITGVWKLGLELEDIDLPRAFTGPDQGKGRAITWAESALIASELHPVHQVTLWLLRIFGLRISEVYGILLKDIELSAHGMTIAIRRQGGGGQFERDDDGNPEEVITRDGLKTAFSRRVLVVPAPLVPLIDTVIDIFHRDSDGAVNENQPLIPGLQVIDQPKKAGFTNALKVAAGLHRIDIGHVAGDSVNETSYVIHDTRLTLVHKVAEAIAEMVATELPEGLMTPTRRRCTNRSQPALAANARRIDSALEEAGWLIEGAAEANVLLFEDIVALTTQPRKRIARWLHEGTLTKVHIPQPGGRPIVGAKASDVQELMELLANRKSIGQLADELGRPYEQIWRWVTIPEVPTILQGTSRFLVYEERRGARKTRSS